MRRVRQSGVEQCTRKMGRMADALTYTLNFLSAVCWIVFCYDLFAMFLYLCSG